jgi:transposase
MKRLSKSIVDDAIVMSRNGKSAREVSRTLGISVGSVLNIRKRGLDNMPESKKGGPWKVSKTTRRHLAREYDTGHIQTLRGGQQLVQSAEGVQVHARTVERYIHIEGLKTYVQRKKPDLTKEQMAARYTFAREHLDWTMNDWRNIMFSHETTISRIGSYGRKFYRRRPGNTRPESNPTRKTKQGGGGKMMIWGCMTYNGLGDACRLQQGLDSQLYVKVLQDYLIASRNYRGLNPAKFIFQQDNAKVHTANIVKEYFHKYKIAVMDWPVNSPDLNPIESLWAYLKQQLDQYDTDPKCLDELWERVQDVWENVPDNFIQSLYSSMPRRMRVLYEHRGAAIDY